MEFSTKIKMAEAVARMKTGKFKYEELEQIAAALGAELIVNFRFPDGTEV